MAKEFLGTDAVNDLFDIIDENYVSKEDFEKREQEIASAICVNSLLIAKCLLKVAEAIKFEKDPEGYEIATDEEIDIVLDNFFN